MNTFTVISIDDHSLFRSGMELIVRTSFPGAHFASYASLGEALERHFAAPDIVLLDLHLDGIGGHEAIPLLKLRWPACAIVVVTSELDQAEIARARAAGGDDVVLKSASPERFISVMRAFAPHTTPDAASPSAIEISRRQLDVLRDLREGYSNKMIAKRMGISEFTVRGHVQQILKVLNASSRSQAVFKAQSVGIL